MRRRKGLSFYQKKKKISASVMKEIWNVIFITIACWMLAFVLMFCFGMRTTVIGVSMEPSLYNGQHILVNRFVYKLSSPKNGDIVVFLPNGNSNTHYYVKRVIALPGDTVQIKNGTVYVNGKVFDEKIEAASIEHAELAEDEIEVGEDEFFVLGDNRNNSEDSRYANIGNVKKEYIVGKAWFIVSPLKDFGFVK